MAFASYGFIIFSALLLLIYYILPAEYRWILLLAGSLIFYAFSGVKGLIFVFATVTSVYLSARLISKINDRKYVPSETKIIEDAEGLKADRNRFKKQQKRKTNITAAVCVAINLTLMILVRVTDLFYALGISFYTLQAFGYLFDVKRKKYGPEKNYFRFMLFMIFFPQIPQGPINRFDILSKTLYKGGEGQDKYKNICFGLLRMTWGFFKKLVIADRISPALMSIIKNDDEGIYVLAAMIFYAIRLYGDFTGGMDIALGLSEALGVGNSENFERPYFSKSIAEYWRRWHITLGTWMKDYVFYPISVSKPMLDLSKSARRRLGNGLGKRLPVYASTVAVWLLTGLWHGLKANFILWGMLNCVIILISQECSPLYKKFAKKIPGVKGSRLYGCFEVVRTFFLMSALRMLDCYTDVGRYFGKLFGIFTNFIPDNFSFGSFTQLGIDLKDYIIVFAGCLVIFAVSFAEEMQVRKGKNLRNLFEKNGSEESSGLSPLVPAAIVVLFAIVLLLGAYGKGYEASDFIYTRF